MGVENILLVMALVFGFYMAWSIGANDVANAMGTSIGSGALNLRKAVIIAATLEFAGAVLVGSHVSDTVKKGIVDPLIFSGEPLYLVYGMIAALLASAVWLQLASYYGWPVSTTHAIVGAILGFGVVLGGIRAVHWHMVGSIIASWVVSPLVSGTISYLIFQLLHRKIYFTPDPISAAKKLTPWLVFFVFTILTLVMVFKGLKNLNFDLPFTQAVGVASGVGLIAAFVSRFLVRRIKIKGAIGGDDNFVPSGVYSSLSKAVVHLEHVKESAPGEIRVQAGRILEEISTLVLTVGKKVNRDENGDELRAVERIFVYLQILSACFVAFSHGANDVANAIGPLAAALDVLKTGTIAEQAMVPLWVLALGGLGIVAGLATWGWRVIETIGKRITELTPTRGFAAEFGAATTIVFASKLGLPVSTTHTLVGAVFGVGIARGIGALNLQTVRDIVLSWVITIPVAAVLAVIIFYLLRAIFS